MESTENKYAHLLQPIRELTKNWDVDLASELNDYLEELDEMCITFDEGKIRMNFAEAALLIQGSACIYSKKVELLHHLVYQTLECINDKNKKQDKHASASQEDNAKGTSRSHNADDDDDSTFVSLDDDISENSQKTDSNMSANVAPLRPESLIPPEAYEKHKLPLISMKGEVVCSQKDFSISLFIPGEENLILLTLSSTFRLLEDKLSIQTKTRVSAPQKQNGFTQPAEGAAGCEANADDAAGDAGENFLPLEDNGMEVDNEPEERIERHRAPSEGRMIRERREVESNKARREEEEETPATNAWTFNDPYVAFREDKPLKAGKCYRVPEGLDDAGKRKRKRPVLLQDLRSWFTGTFDPPEHKLKNGPTFTVLNDIYLSTMKDKLKSRKRLYRKVGMVVSDKELRQTFLQPEGAGLQGEEPVEGLQHPDLLGGDEENSDNEHEPFPDDIPAEFGGRQDFIPADQTDELCYEDHVKLCVEQLVASSRSYIQETALSRRVKDWEDKMQPVLTLQEERSAFDIHDYSDRIVGALRSVGHRRSFASIVSGLDNFEACKHMLASLQLANDYTVEIDSVQGLEENLDTMGLTLLSTHRAADRFKTLKAST
ncbi:hypothetical protein LDENG_00148300 [Lucifuga dentata]|nr:hypothetical protein LDENG_00148300 [Lucifuga dentata]